MAMPMRIGGLASVIFYPLAGVLVAAAETMQEAVRGLRDIKNPAQVLEACKQVNVCENQGDTLCRRAIANGVSTELDNGQELDLPRSGVEVVSAQKRSGQWYYEVRDLRTREQLPADPATWAPASLA